MRIFSHETRHSNRCVRYTTHSFVLQQSNGMQRLNFIPCACAIRLHSKMYSKMRCNYVGLCCLLMNSLMNFHNQFHDCCIVFIIVINSVVFVWLVMAAGYSFDARKQFNSPSISATFIRKQWQCLVSPAESFQFANKCQWNTARTPAKQYAPQTLTRNSVHFIINLSFFPSTTSWFSDRPNFYQRLFCAHADTPNLSFVKQVPFSATFDFDSITIVVPQPHVPRPTNSTGVMRAISTVWTIITIGLA